MPYEIDGVLNDQATYYIDKYKEIQFNIDQQANYLAQGIGLTANASISAPLKDQFRTSSVTQSYL